MASKLRSNSASEGNPLLADGLSPKFHEAIFEESPKECIELNFFQEAIDLLKLTLPIIATLMLEFLPGAFSVALVGHIDSPLRKEYVDAAMLAVMFLNITGVSIGSGLSTAMDTLCSQTVGAGKLYYLGMYFQSGLIVLACMYVPCLLLNFKSEFFLVALGQDPTVAKLAGSFSRVSVFSLPGIFLYELLKKVLQAQKIVSPMAYIAILTNCIYFGMGNFFCYHTELGFLGAAYARTISQLLLPVFGFLYLMWNPVYKDWWPADHTFSKQWQAAWEHVPQFFSLGAPGMLMIVMEWWAYEVCALIAGWMSNPVLSISVQSVLMGLASQAYSIFLGLNIATTVRLGNALGSNEPHRAQLISKVAIGVALMTGILVSLFFLITHDALPQLLTGDPATIEYVLGLMLGVTMSSGFGILLAFHFSLGVQGLWIGLGGGLLFGFGVYLRYIGTVNWKQMAEEAISRTSK